MVAYSFQARFAPLIADGSKTQTIWGARARHARPAEDIQLYCGMRTKACRKIIQDPVCIAVSQINIYVHDGPTRRAYFRMSEGNEETSGIVTDDWARADGFCDAEDFTEFWWRHHRARGHGHDGVYFFGWLIRWAPQ